MYLPAFLFNFLCIPRFLQQHILSLQSEKQDKYFLKNKRERDSGVSFCVIIFEKIIEVEKIPLALEDFIWPHVSGAMPHTSSVMYKVFLWIEDCLRTVRRAGVLYLH